MKTNEYIDVCARYAQKATENVPLFPSVIMAQAVFESAEDDGSPGILASIAKNHFKTKPGRGWRKAKTITLLVPGAGNDSPIQTARYKVYDDDQQSFTHHVQWLGKKGLCNPSGIFSAPTPGDQARALQRAIYPNLPRFADIIIALMDRYDLYRLDPSTGVHPVDGKPLIQNTTGNGIPHPHTTSY